MKIRKTTLFSLVYAVAFTTFVLISTAFAQTPSPPPAPGVDPALIEQIFSLLQVHKYAAIGVIVIGFVENLISQNEPRIPINIPDAVRPFVVLALGIGSSVLDKIDHGTSWKSAVEWGVVAALVTLYSKYALLGVRGGKPITLFKPKPAPTPATNAVDPPKDS